MEENNNESLKQSEEVDTKAEKLPTLTESQSEIVESENLNSDDQGGKKPRKPFVFTEARKAAFERCRVRRAEKLKEIREGVVSKPLTVRQIKKELTRARLEYKTKIDLFKQSISRNQSADQLTQSKELTISALQPNVSELPSAPAPVAQSMEVNEVPITAMIQQQQQLQTESQTSLPSAIPSMEVEMTSSNSSSSSPTTAFPTQSDERKRKHSVHFQDEIETREHAVDEEEDDVHMGVGAGNHPPYDQVIDPTQLDDDTLMRLLQEARARQERGSMFESRRVEVKAPRPSNASMFLDTIQPMYNHPSQLFNVNSQFVKREPRPQASNSFVWL